MNGIGAMNTPLNQGHTYNNIFGQVMGGLGATRQ